VDCRTPLYAIDIWMQSSGTLLRRQQYLMEQIYTESNDMDREGFLRLASELFRIEEEIVNRGITSKKVIRKMNKHAIRMRVI
jgi:hypothetical protein